jgi:DNA invertase Pin-like site-specific DNA recombinase
MAAKKRGKFPGRPPIGKEKLDYAFYLMEQGMTITEAAEKVGVSRMTLYRKMKK